MTRAVFATSGSASARPGYGGVQVGTAAPGSSLDASRAAEPDRHFVAVEDDRYVPAPPGHGEHPIERRSILLDVDVLELDTPPDMVLTGGQRVGSRVLAEDADHGSLSLSQSVRARRHDGLF